MRQKLKVLITAEIHKWHKVKHMAKTDKWCFRKTTSHCTVNCKSSNYFHE